MLYNQIETSRLLLIRPEDRHFLILRELWLNETVRRFLGGKIEEEGVSQKIKYLQEHWLKNGYGQYAVYEKNIRELIGICGFQHSNDGTEIVYMFFNKFWGNGYATEAVLASIDFGFKNLGLKVIIGITQEANKPSCRLLEKIGMKHTDSFHRFNEKQRMYQITNREVR